MRVTIEDDDGRIQTFTVTQDGDVIERPSKPRPERHDVLEGDTVNVKAEEIPDDDDVYVEQGQTGPEPPPAEEEELDPPCFLCENFIEDMNSQFCFGCRAFICSEHPQDPWGTHMPDDHDKP